MRERERVNVIPIVGLILSLTLTLTLKLSTDSILSTTPNKTIKLVTEVREVNAATTIDTDNDDEQS